MQDTSRTVRPGPEKAILCYRCEANQVRNLGEICTRCLELELPAQVCEIYGTHHVFDEQLHLCPCGAEQT